MKEKEGMQKLIILRSQIDVPPPRLIFLENKSGPSTLLLGPPDPPFINFICFLLRQFFIFAKL